MPSVRIVIITGGGWQIWGESALALRRLGFGEGVSPSPIRVRFGARKFLTFWLKIVHFGIYSDKNSQFSRE